MDLLEREQCLAELHEWLQSAGAHEGRIALVSGEAGVGKTSLLRAFCAAPHSARVLWGACDALFTPRPLAPVHDIARQTKGDLLTAVTAGTHRDEIFGLALDELERPQPTIMILEDMQWADEATLDLVKFIGRRIYRSHTLLIVTYRDDEVGPRHPLRSVIGDLPRRSLVKMTVPALSLSAVANLARQVGRSAEGLHRATGGNPLFVTEVLASPAGTLPDTVRDAVLARAARLSPGGREVAELVSVVPSNTEAWLLEQTLRPGEAEIASCLSIGMVLAPDGALSFRHELARRAFEDSLSAVRKERLHAMVLEALRARDGTLLARLAHHAGGARNTAEVLRYAPAAAAQAAAIGAHREAASQLQLALRYAGDLHPEERASLLEHYSVECHLTSQHEQAIHARGEALEIWRASAARVREGDALGWLSRMSWFAGRRDAADQYSAESIGILESLPEGPELAMAYANRAQLDMEAHDSEAAIKWAQHAIGLAQRWSSDEILCDALNTLGTTRLVVGDASGWTDLDRCLQLARAADHQVQVARAFTNSCAMAVSRREYDKASGYLQHGLEYCERRDLDPWWLYLLSYRARLKFERGDWFGASEDAETVLQHPRTSPVTRIPTLRVLGHLRIRRGDPDAHSPLAEARTLANPMQELQRRGTIAAALGEEAWLAGDRTAVLREVEPVYALVCTRRDPRMKGELAVLLWRVDALDQSPTDIPEPDALEISGDWQGAAGKWQALGCPYEQATVLGLYGGESEQRAAITIFDQLGAAPAARLVRAKMRARGVRSVPRGARSSTRGNAFGLTKREAQILDLLAKGLPNSAIAKRLFISKKTVDHHVSAVLLKLGVASRAEAIATVARRLDDPQ